MATITVTIPDAVAVRVRDAFTTTYSYQTTIDGQPNPETPTQFVQRMVRDYVKQTLVNHEAQAAARTATGTATTDVG